MNTHQKKKKQQQQQLSCATGKFIGWSYFTVATSLARIAVPCSRSSDPVANMPAIILGGPRNLRGGMSRVSASVTVFLLFSCCTVLYCTVPYCSVVYCSWPVMFTCSVLVVLSLCYAPCPVSLVQCCTFRAHRIRVFTSPLYQLMRSSPAGQGNKCDLSLRRFLCSLLPNYTTRFSPRNMEPPD